MKIRDRIINVLRYNKFFWIVLCFLAIVNLMIYFIVGGYQKRKINELQDRYRTKRMIKPTKKYPEQLKLIHAKQDIQLFINQLSSRTEFPNTVAELFQIIQRHGLSISTMSYKPELIGFHSLLKFTTSFSVKGKYQPLKGFLADVQRSKTLFCIDSLSIINKSMDEDSIEVKLQISTYFR